MAAPDIYIYIYFIRDMHTYGVLGNRALRDYRIPALLDAPKHKIEDFHFHMIRLCCLIMYCNMYDL